MFKAFRNLVKQVPTEKYSGHFAELDPDSRVSHIKEINYAEDHSHVTRDIECQMYALIANATSLQTNG